MQVSARGITNMWPSLFTLPVLTRRMKISQCVHALQLLEWLKKTHLLFYRPKKSQKLSLNSDLVFFTSQKTESLSARPPPAVQNALYRRVPHTCSESVTAGEKS